MSKAELLQRDDAAVQLALGESQIVAEIREYLINHGERYYYIVCLLYMVYFIVRQVQVFFFHIQNIFHENGPSTGVKESYIGYAT